MPSAAASLFALFVVVAAHEQVLVAAHDHWQPLAEDGPDAACAHAAEDALAMSACLGVPARVAATSGYAFDADAAAATDPPCNVACAELWLTASAGCPGKLTAAFQSVAPDGVAAACEATVAKLSESAAWRLRMLEAQAVRGASGR